MAIPLKTLIVEDSEDDAALLVIALRQAGYAPQMRRVEDEAEFQAGLAEMPDLILSDFRLPQFSVQRALERLRASALEIPFIVVSGSIGEEQAVDCIKAGATDYLLKDRLQRLGPAVARAQQEFSERKRRRQAEEQLRLRTTALENAANAVLITDAKGDIVWVNAAFTTISGYAASEVVGRNPRFLKADQQDTAFYQRMWAALTAGQTWQGEFINRRKDGSCYYGEQTITPVRVETGEITHYIGIMNDVTARKEAEASLSLFRTFIGQSKDGFEVIDPETGRFVDVNDTCCLEHGYTRAEMLQLTVPEVEMDSVNKENWKSVVAQIRQAGFKTIEGRHRRKDGSTFPVEVNVKYISLDRDYLVAVVRDVTERKRAEAALRESEARLRIVTDNARIGLVMIDPDYRYLYANAAYSEILDLPGGELVGRRVAEVLPDVFGEQIQPRLQRAFAGERVAYELRRGTSRQERHYSVNYEPIWTGGGVSHVLVVIADISERKRAEAALQESEGRFRELAETIDEVFWVSNPTKDCLLYVSPAYESVWGRTCQSLYDSPWTWVDAICPDDRERVVEAARTRQLAGTYDEEYRIVRPDGAVRWVHDQAYPVRDASGQVERIVGVAKDVTSRRAATEELRATNFRYAQQEAALMELTRAFALGQASIPELMRQVTQTAAQTLNVERASIWCYGSDRRSIVCRELYQQSTQAYSDGMQLLARDFPMYFQALAGGEVIAVNDAEQDGRTAEFAETYLQPLGIKAMLDAPMHASDGVAGVLCLEHVNTPRRWTTDEQTFAVAAANVVSLLLAEEARQRIEAQFRQSQKLEAIGQLAGGVAHDFNNLLGVIRGYADLLLLETSETDENTTEHLKQIAVASDRAANLTRQLLLFSRRQVMQSRDLDLNECVASLAKMLQRIIGEDIRLQLHLNPRPLSTRADAGMLDQVLMNLVVNARDAMPQGGRLLIETAEKSVDEDLARVYPDATPGRYVWLSVSDNGVGIPPEVLPRIFEPFFTTKDAGKGTGLGLATVFGIIKQHQGWIKAYSEPGQGTNFQIFLPASSVSPGEEKPAPSRPQLRGGTETILVAEDDPALRSLTRLVLERRGYRVLVAANGMEALQLWERHRSQVALLLTDLVMPEGLSGQQLARRLREDNPRLKIIFTSGYSGEIAGRELELRSGENFLQKPVPPEQLLTTVRANLDGT